MDNRGLSEEITAADLLANHLLLRGMKIGRMLEVTLKRTTEPQTVYSLQRLVVGTVFKEAGGKTASLMAKYLRLTLKKPDARKFTWEPSNMMKLQAEAKLIAEEIYTTKKVSHVHQAGSLLSTYVNDQIDRTIEVNHRPLTRRVRHLTAGACDWCEQQKISYDAGGDWLRHANCNCYSVSG